MPEFGMPEYWESVVKLYKEEGLGKMGKEVAPDLDLAMVDHSPPKPEIGLDPGLYLLIKIEKGVLTEMKYIKKEEAEKIPLSMTVPYDFGKTLFTDAAKGKVPDLMAMIMGGKLKIKGDISKMMKYAGALPKLMPAMLGLLGKVETIWPDEYPPDKLEDFKVRLKKTRERLGV